MSADQSVTGVFGDDPRAVMVRHAVLAALGIRGAALRDLERRVEGRRRQLLDTDRQVNTRLPHQPPLELGIAEVVDSVGKRRGWSRFLAALAHQRVPDVTVELGASVGLTTAYLAGSSRGHVHAVEGVPDVAEVARETLRLVGADGAATVHVGRFKDVLPGLVETLGPVGLVFIDGDHEGEATLAYLDLLRPVLDHRSIVVLDDIRWSPGMTRAWRAITARPDTGLVCDLRRLGIWGPRDGSVGQSSNEAL